MHFLLAIVLAALLGLPAAGQPAAATSPSDAAGPSTAASAPQTSSFRITFDAALLDRPYTGRVYIALSKRSDPEPRLEMGDWFGGPQAITLDVTNLAPGGSVTIDESSASLTYPAPSFAKLPAGEYFAQAVARVDPDSPSPGRGEGDLLSDVVKVTLSPVPKDNGSAACAELKLSRRAARRSLEETNRIKLVEIKSNVLSEFHGREVKARAGVVLPPDWKDDPSIHYPTVYFITGFGDGERFARGVSRFIAGRQPANGIIFVVPDPLCATGHSVFADSANNGPRSESLLRELIPAVEQRFHGAGSGARRFVTGISSGGWSSLWLQVAYPDEFNGCWSHCPDPVDFRNFQQIDLYAPGANMYTDANGQRRPLSRGPAGNAVLFYDDFVRQETVMGSGGQIGSFEAVFSPRGADGKPTPLFDRSTGAVNPTVAKAWERYDIRLKLEREWATLAPKLAGKIHVYAGEKDNFYLEGAARLLKDALAHAPAPAPGGEDPFADIQIIPNMMHTIYRPGMEAMLTTIREKCGIVPPASAKPDEAPR